MMRRLGGSESNILIAQGALASSYEDLGRHEQCLTMRREVYSGHLKLHGEEHFDTLRVAENYALSLLGLKRFEEAKSLLRKTMPVARRVFGENNELTLRMRMVYATTLFNDDDATLDDLREAVTTLEEIERIARRVLGFGFGFISDSRCRNPREILRRTVLKRTAPHRSIAGGAIFLENSSKHTAMMLAY